MAQNRESLSEISRRRTSWILSVLGLLVLILFITVLCSLNKKKETNVVPMDETDFTQQNTFDGENDESDFEGFGDQGAQLRVTPSEIFFPDVVLGSKAEGNLVLRAENGPVAFDNKYLADKTEGGFLLSGPCMERTQLDTNEECVLKVSWAPVVVQTIQNTLTIVWREDSKRTYGQKNLLSIQLKASSTDSKECVCCEIQKEKEPKVLRKVVQADGTVRELQEGEKIVDDVILDEEGRIVGIVEPERVALGLNNEYLGRVTDRRTVEDKDGTTLGRLLGDDTLVDSDFKILGAAIPLVSVLDAQGFVIGKMIADDEGVRVVDAESQVIGTPRVDMSVVDRTGAQIGMIRPWGAVLDLSGNYMGIIAPTGAVVNEKQEVIGYIQQNGFVTDKSGVLIGGVVPRGMAVGTGCRSYGAVALNGQVKDAYGQVVGRVMLDGGVVDTNFNEIGNAVNQGLVVDMKGHVVGFVNSEGKAVDGRGMLMGCVAPNGTVAANKKMVGGVLQKGYVVGSAACSVLGSVYPDARVMSADVKEVGAVRSDGYVLSPSSKVIGAVVPHGTVFAGECRLVGMISVTGQILNEKNMSVGCLNMQKQALDADGKEIGKITPTGPVLAADGSLIGRVRYDGRIIDKAGKVVDCASPDSESVPVDKGVILDENGQPTAWTTLAGKCFNERNEEIGTIAFNGWVSDKQGRMIGFMPPDGTIFSPTGFVLGQYNRLMGVVLDAKGDDFGRVMPDWTVLDTKGTKILGALVAQNTTFASLDGTPLGKLNYEGQVLDENNNSMGRVLADGSLYNDSNILIGGALPSGVVLSAAGKQIGWANVAGDVLAKGTRIASVLPNGLAVTPDNRVLGRVWLVPSVVVSARGVTGTIVPKAEGKDNTSYQAAAYDKMGNYLGMMSPFGVLLGADGRLGGIAAPISMVMNLQHSFIGWVGFNGQVLNPEAKVIGQLIQNGLVVNAEGEPMGFVIRKGTVVDTQGSFVGRVGPDGIIYNGSGATGFHVGAEAFFSNDDFSETVRLLPDGVAVSASGKMLGWSVLDGRVVNSEQMVGLVSADNRVLDAEGQLLAGYVALGAPSIQENEKMCGVVNEAGAIVTASGRSIGSVVAPDYAVQNNAIIGRIRSESLFVRDLVNTDLVGVADLDSLVYKPNTARQTSALMMNGLAVDSAKKVVAGLIPTGFAISTNLKALGREDFSGSVWLAGRVVGAASGIGLVEQEGGVLTGSVVAPETVIDRNGLKIGRTNALSAVIDQAGKKIASRMAFYSVLTPETIWAGGPLKTGAVIDDYARKIGVVAGDGTIVGGGIFRGRVLPDGSAAGVSERAVYNSMPYIGHLTTQGVPMGYNESVLGRTTVQGDLIDASDKVIYQTLDDGTVLGKERPLEGVILSFRPAVSYNDENLGVFDGDGKIFAQGEELGHLAANGALVASTAAGTETALSKLKEAGGLIPESLIVNDSCQVIGQPAYTGEVIDGQGNTVGRVQPTLYAKDPQGKDLGRSVRYGPVTSLDSKGFFIGRTLSDSTVVDPDGVNIGCVRMDKMLIDAEGNQRGRLRNRGPVFDMEKKMVGRVDAMGRVVGVEGKVIGVIGGADKDIFYDLNGNERGWMADKEDRLIFNPDGTLDLAISRDGWVKDGSGEVLYRLDQKNNTLYDKWGNVIGSLTGDNLVFLYDMQDKIVARLLGCDLQKIESPNAKMGTVLANGEIRDENNELILSALADGKVYNPDGTQFGRFAGVGLDLRRCGLSSMTTVGQPTGRKISLSGCKNCTVTPEGMIVDKNNKIVGSWDPSNNMPVIWTPQTADVNTDLPPPPLPVQPGITPEMRQHIVDIQQERRDKMKKQMASSGNLVLPGYNVEQMAQTGISKDWSSVGTPKNNVSTWPVDMSRVLLADKAIPAVLVRSIDSRYPDVPVTAIVERHIYAEEGRNILIPAGSRLIGSLDGSAASFGMDQAAKLSISWSRLIRPDGAAFKFEAKSGDAQGRGGVAAYLDLQLAKKFALPITSSIGNAALIKLTELAERQSVREASAGVAVGGESGGTGSTGNANSQIRSMFLKDFQDIWDQLISMAEDIPNIVYVPSGTRLTAFANDDLWLRSDDDPAEEKSNSFKEMMQAGTYLSKNNSWTKERANDREDKKPKTDKSNETINSDKVSPGLDENDEDAIYVPDDIDRRTVNPVNRPPEEKPVYF